MHADFAQRRGGDGERIAKRQALQEMLLRVIEHLADGRKIASENPLQAVKRAEHVAGVDHRAPAAADEEILAVIGHADDLVRHDLADGNNQII